MTSSIATAPSRIHSIVRALPTVSICRGATRADQARLEPLWLRRPAAIEASSACARSIVAPGFSRAIALR